MTGVGEANGVEAVDSAVTAVEEARIASIDKEFAAMRSTMARMVALMREHSDRMAAHDDRFNALEDMVETRLNAMNVRIDALAGRKEKGKPKRRINEEPERLAYACYLRYMLNVPASRIVRAGVLSSNKMYGLGEWGSDFRARRFAELGVSDIYVHGLSWEDAEQEGMFAGEERMNELREYCESR